MATSGPPKPASSSKPRRRPPTQLLPVLDEWDELESEARDLLGSLHNLTLRYEAVRRVSADLNSTEVRESSLLAHFPNVHLELARTMHAKREALLEALRQLVLLSMSVLLQQIDQLYESGAPSVLRLADLEDASIEPAVRDDAISRAALEVLRMYGAEYWRKVMLLESLRARGAEFWNADELQAHIAEWPLDGAASKVDVGIGAFHLLFAGIPFSTLAEFTSLVAHEKPRNTRIYSEQPARSRRSLGKMNRSSTCSSKRLVLTKVAHGTPLPARPVHSCCRAPQTQQNPRAALQALQTRGAWASPWSCTACTLS